MSKRHSKILLTGSSGLLGRHLKLKADRPSHKKLDITKPIKPGKYDLIIHCAAYTKVELAEEERLKCFDVNVRGTLNLLNAYPNTPLVYISSEYASNPVNFYALTKYLAEELISHHSNFLIIRTLFKPRPWKYPKAFIDQWTQGDYVDVIAPLIEKEIKNWDRKGKTTIYVGTERKTIYELAKQTRPDVGKMSIYDIKSVMLPEDYW